MPDTEFRIGHGYDIHRLQAGGRLVLGGVEVSEEMSPIAHSDGDVVIHAIVDAILGALQQGDIGQHFPDTDPCYRGAASLTFLQVASNLAEKLGFVIVNADLTILAERPKLAPFKAAMASTLAGAMHGAAVNIKAGTNEGCDAVGRGEAIAAHAVVLLAKRNENP